MIAINGKDLYLAALERDDCRKLWNDFEYDFEHPVEPFNIGHGIEKADAWYDEIQRDQGGRHVRLGIFLWDDTVVGDIALQDIDRENRCCSVGMGIAKLVNRGRGYGGQALELMLRYGFDYLGMERITANTLVGNVGAIRSLEQAGFMLEGTERKAVYMNGKKHDRLNYAVLKDEFVFGK